MTLRDDVLPIISAGWGLVEDFGFAPYTVTVRTRTWSGGTVQLGTATVSDLVLSPNPQVEENGDAILKVYGITPSHAGGGYTYAQLRPSESAGAEYYYSVSGPNGTHLYSLDSIDTSETFGAEYTLTLRALTRAMPF